MSNDMSNDMFNVSYCQILTSLHFIGWEVEIGTSQGSLEHRNTFKRKIDPVVNGVST